VSIHAITQSGDHRPDRWCRCGPIQAFDLLESDRIVWVHGALADEHELVRIADRADPHEAPADDDAA
jgi:hypothetical protein